MNLQIDPTPKLDSANLDPNNFCGSGLKVHPIASLFPMIEGKEFDELVLDVQSHGLQNPIVVLDGVLIDGRNRMRACAKCGIPPKYAPYTWYKNREYEWIISQNIHRRSLTPDQRAALVAKYYDWKRAEDAARMARVEAAHRTNEKKAGSTVLQESSNSAPVKSRAKTRTGLAIAKQAGVNREKAQKVIFVAKNKPELLDDVLSGKTNLTDAERIAREAVGKVQAKRDAWDMAKEVRRFARHLEAVISAAPTNYRTDFREALWRVTEDLCK